MMDKSISGWKIQDREFSVEELSLIAVAVAMDKKASRPIVIDLKPQGAFTEYFSIVSASNSRQVRAIAEEIRIFFKRAFGISPVAADGFETCSWILLDYGSFFIHVFQEPTRELYRLENLWSKGRFLDVREDLALALMNEVKGLMPAESSFVGLVSQEEIEPQYS
jgi:ribosome-associated protein